MEIIDKAAWQIDGGVPKEVVVSHFNIVFSWLYNHDMLTEDGIEEYEGGIDDSASLNDELINEKGMSFLGKCYDKYLNTVAQKMYGKDIVGNILEKIYNEFENEIKSE